jgi:hypothetical protein
MEKISKVRKDTYGSISDVQFQSGKEVTIDVAIDMAKKNLIENVIVGKAKDGSETLRSQANNSTADNLSNLPTF